MKLSNETLSILKNYVTINPSLAIDAGNVITTMSPLKTIVAKATIPETFEVPFAIYDMTQFLSVISIFDNPEFDYQEDHVNIKPSASSGTSIKYVYADRNMILSPPKKELTLPDPAAQFQLTEDLLDKTMKISATLGLPYWRVLKVENSLFVEVLDEKNPTSNKFEHEIETVEFNTDEDFVVSFKCENLKIMKRDYVVDITTKGINKFTSDDETLTYYIASLKA